MRSIYEYEDYRRYLKDFFAEQKRKSRVFSQRYFAQKAGFSSHSYCAFLVRGERNLTRASLAKMIRGLRLEGKMAAYFEKMVSYTQSADVEEKKRLFRELNSLRRNSRFYQLNKNHYRYFEHWYYPVIRHLATYIDWHNDYALLGSLVRPPISAEKARQAIGSLVEMGLLAPGAGHRPAGESALFKSDEVPGVIKSAARRNVLQRAIEAADSLGPGERYVSWATLSMSEKTYRDVIECLEKAKLEIYRKVMEDEQVERIYQMAFALFPVSGRFHGGTHA